MSEGWFPGAVIALLGMSVFTLLGIWWDVRAWMRESRRDRREDRRP